VLNAGDVSTTSALKTVLGGHTVTSTAKTTGVNLLNGLITADAVTTTSTSSVINGKLTSTAKTQFANLHIAGLKLPVNVPTNYGVTIPGVATVALNMVIGGTKGNVTVGNGAGLAVTLLKAQGSNAAGASIYLSPTYTSAETSDVPDTGHQVAGMAYGTKISAAAGTTLSVKSDPTAPIAVPAPGTHGATKSTSVLGVHVSPVVTTGIVTDSVKATNTTASGDAQATSKIGSASLLGGLIKVGAVTSTAHSVAATGKSIALTGSSTIARLTISGKTIPVSTKPNTTISLAGLGKIVLNEQTKTTNTIVVAALHVTLSTAAYGLPAGAEIVVGVASASSL